MAGVLPCSIWLDTTERLVLSCVLLVAAVVLYAVGHGIYNLCLHPLHSYPGPILWRISHLPYDYNVWNGTYMTEIAKLHKLYGPVVRIAPDELSYTDAQAWQDIFAHKPGKEEWPKNPSRINKTPNGIPNILGAEKEAHGRYRRLLAHVFSEKGLKEQQPLITKYVDLLMDRLVELAKTGEEVDMVQWFNMVVFDVIGDLAWGASFNTLEARREHEWILAVLGSLRFVITSNVLRYHGLERLIPYTVPKEVQASRVMNYKYMAERVDERVKLGTARGDFWDRVLIKSADGNASGEGMSKAEMLNNAAVLVLGGSETSATTLSGSIYLLLKNPSAMERLVREIRTSFSSSEDIDAFSIGKLKYMFAVLEETMRVYPPVPG